MKRRILGLLACVSFVGAQAEERVVVYETAFLDTNKVVEVSLQPQYFFKTPFIEGKGRVFSIESDLYDSNISITNYAVADDYYYFEGWKGETNTTENPLILVLDKPYTNIVAEFKPILSSRGTPYEWYAQYGITNNLANADDLDTDGDGYTGRQEYIWGTNPNDARSYPKYYLEKSEGEIYFVIPETTSRSIYSVYENSKLLHGRWNEIYSGQGNDSKIMIPLQRDKPMNFYKAEPRLK